MSDDGLSGLASAWQRYCDSLREEGARVLEGGTDATSDAEVGEALRCVARLAEMALRHRVDFNDPDFPLFFRALDDHFKYAGPDAYVTYLSAPVRGDATYRITGNHLGRDFSVGPMWSSALSIEPDGSFEIEVSSMEQGGNAIRIDPSFVSGQTVPDMYPMASGGVSSRMYYDDLEDQQPAGGLIIERVDDQRPQVPAPFSVDRFADQVSSAVDLFVAMSRWWLERAARIRTENEPNHVGAPGRRPPGVPGYAPPPTSPLHYGVCCWELGPDEALVVESDVPACRYWSFQLYNAWWESPDVQNRQTSISHKHAYLDSDGRFRAVLSARDPGVPNWLDTADGARGFMFYRWLRPTGETPTPVAVRTPLDRVRDRLPAEHPVVDAHARRRQLTDRRAFFAKRFQR